MCNSDGDCNVNEECAYNEITFSYECRCKPGYLKFQNSTCRQTVSKDWSNYTANGSRRKNGAVNYHSMLLQDVLRAILTPPVSRTASPRMVTANVLAGTEEMEFMVAIRFLCLVT